MLQAQLQSATHEIDHQRPIRIAVAISSYDCQSRPDCAKLIENDVRANITQVPYFVSVFSEFVHLLRQTVVRVRNYENAQRLFRVFLVRHVTFEPFSSRMSETTYAALDACAMGSGTDFAGIEHPKKGNTMTKHSLPINGMHHVSLRVSDMDRSLAFYRDVLSFSPKTSFMLDGLRFAMLETGNDV